MSLPTQAARQTSGSASGLGLFPFQIVSANGDRQALTLYNNSGMGLRVLAGGVPTTYVFMTIIGSGSYYELPTPVFTGPIYGKYDNALLTGSVNFVDFSV